jgi:hypothetical protein
MADAILQYDEKALERLCHEHLVRRLNLTVLWWRATEDILILLQQIEKPIEET